MNLLIGIIYITIGTAVMYHSAQHFEPALRRARFWFFGSGIMQLGAWNSLLYVQPSLAVQYEWMRQTGHLCLIVFSVIYLFHSCQWRQPQ
ncbi:hypothetical protein [Tsuneonella suprasediminis]|uniref:hypothetical protein n=1 Tax=Tsuneonella suprasediminis TaxID=2306996 RepID=UPI002F932E88